MPDDSLRLAVLVDADNASAAVIGDILSEVASLGTASVKRVYGDFTTSNLHSWRAVLLEHAIQPVQQFRNTIGKNASDSALIIDAMDLLHTRELGGFCLVSSDSDFTRLATRIREDGLLSMVLARRRRLDPSSTPATASFIPRYSEQKRSALQRQ
jgi:NYN domain